MSRRDRTLGSVMSFEQCQLARRQARAATARRYQALARRPHVTADPATVTPAVPKARLVRLAVRIVDQDAGLVEWVTGLLEAQHVRPGRPRELSVRTGLVCFLLQVLVYKHFMLSSLPEMLGEMSWRVRRNLGIDYLRGGRPSQVSYGQLLDLFHALAAVFDAWDDTLPAGAEGDAVRRERAGNLQEFIDRLVAASTVSGPVWSGNGSLDATLKWSWERPKGVSLNTKVERSGRDGDGAARSVPLSSIVTGDDGEVDPAQFIDPDPVTVVRESSAGRTVRPCSWPSTWGLGSAWVGRGVNKSKSVHGIALHSMVRSDGPLLVEAFTVTPANADPVLAALPLMRRLYDRRAADEAVLAAATRGEVALLGEVVADPAYSTSAWMAGLKLMSARPVARLHRTNQDGLHWHKVGKGIRAGQVATIGGRPVCECIVHTHLPDLRFPKFPYTPAQLHAYQAEVVKIGQFEWAPNGAPAADGSRRYLAPHRKGPDGQSGGCDHCTHTNGAPVIGADGRPRARCCQMVSRTLPLDVIALDQGVVHGSPDWYPMWNVRNRVEGSYGVLKNLSVVNYCRASHHFVGLARETLVAAFAVFAYNVHMLRQWQHRHTLDQADTTGPGLPELPSADVTATLPPPSKRSVRQRRGPKGLEFLGQPSPPG